MSRPVRVAVVVDSDAFGGAEVWTRRVLGQRPSGIRASLVVARPVAERLGVPDGVERRVVVPLARHRDTAPRAVGAALDVLAPDVVHVNLVDPGSNRAVLDAALGRAPAVVTLHLQGAASSGLRRRYSRVAAAVAPSAAIAVQLVELGVPPERVARVRHGVPLPPAAAAPPPSRSSFVVGGVGRLTGQKGFDLLLAAAARLHGRGRRLQVVIAGEGREEAALRRQAEGLPARFLGFCPDVPALLGRLDVFCLPSRAEALSLALLEAAAHGLPCVTTAVGDTAAALTGAAMIVPPNDLDALTAALDRLLADPALRDHLAARARRRAMRDFDVRRMAAEVAAVWAAAARGSAGGERGVDLGEHVRDR